MEMNFPGCVSSGLCADRRSRNHCESSKDRFKDNPILTGYRTLGKSLTISGPVFSHF